MMNDYGYSLWFLVIVNTAVVLLFAVSFFHPRTRRDWRAFGTFSAFIVALFTEMYGVPLTIYLLSAVGGDALGLNLSHDSGHLWADMIGWKGDPHLTPFHLVSYVGIIGGFWMISAGWKHLYDAAKAGRLATGGLYARMRHPQYAGFLLIMVGFLLQWPTLPTLIMFPILMAVYRRLAISEERDTAAAFPEEWAAYAADKPRFLPRRRPSAPPRPTFDARHDTEPITHERRS